MTAQTSEKQPVVEKQTFSLKKQHLFKPLLLLPSKNRQNKKSHVFHPLLWGQCQVSLRNRLKTGRNTLDYHPKSIEQKVIPLLSSFTTRVNGLQQALLDQSTTHQTKYHFLCRSKSKQLPNQCGTYGCPALQPNILWDKTTLNQAAQLQTQQSRITKPLEKDYSKQHKQSKIAR